MTTLGACYPETQSRFVNLSCIGHLNADDSAT